MLAGILIGIFIGAPIGMIIAALLRASGDDEEQNALNGPKTRDKIRRDKTLATQPERRP
ncbi:MAG TPA: hypothetical protein PLX91_11165 [Thermotogota bacterium]|jgi:gas vesicle protein|nr:hypothetical protein [Thermotogota bacterium]HQN23164.1 hypothetical protein [Thermotogota bacterium]HRS81690.1 hypothetical protein [Thermotogota bacterium]